VALDLPMTTRWKYPFSDRPMDNLNKAGRKHHAAKQT
jgi:hypothetical protein